MKTITTDVLVIGSGFGAAPPALRLAQAGFDVVVLEKGPRLDPWQDFQQTADPRYLFRYLKGVSGDHLGLTYAEGLGGGSGFYEMVSLRAPSEVFAQRDETGHRRWPEGVNRKTMNPYYDVAEGMLNVEQINEREVPKNGLAFSKMMKNLGYSCERARYAVQGCMGCGYCVTGCIYGRKQSLLLNYIPQAQTAGARYETETEALQIRPVRRGRGTRYEVVCRQGHRYLRYRTQRLILAGGTVGTARLLLASWALLPALSPQVGRNIAFNGGVKALALLPDHFENVDMLVGRSHPGVVSYAFMQSHGLMLTTGKPFPLQMVGSARLRLEGDTRDPAHWGQPYVDLMKQYRRRMMVMVAFGMTPPSARLRPVGNGKVKVELENTEVLQVYYRETKALLHDILKRNGCRLIDVTFVNRQGQPLAKPYFGTAHQLGSCRMADTKRKGVCGPSGEVFGYPGLYITDGAAIPTSLAVNPTLTILANAERITDGIMMQYRPHIAVAS